MTIKHIAIWILMMVLPLAAQNIPSGYPKYILGGTTIQVPTTLDTLWILKNSQYKKAVKIAKRQQIDSQKVTILEEKEALYKKIGVEKDSLISTYRKGYLHYRDLWTDTSFKLEEAEVKASKRWRYLEGGFVAGILVTVAVTALMRSI